MSRTPQKPTPGQVDVLGELDVPAFADQEPTVIADSFAEGVHVDVPVDSWDGTGGSLAEDDELLARDGQAASAAGDARRANALSCGRALLAERQGDPARALAHWRDAFDRDPALLVAFWGLRRTLHARGAWDELRAAIDRRIAALSSPRRAEARAELWQERGRVVEDRLGLDEEAARSYRAGLTEAPQHAGLLTSLLLLAFRRGDLAMTAEALTGLLTRPLPSALRASMTASLARIQRGSPTSVVAMNFPAALEQAPMAPVEAPAAARALEALRGALRVVDPDDADPLLGELSLLARATRDPATRVAIIDELVAHLPGAGAAAAEAEAGEEGGGGGALGAALLRERARLLRDHLGQPSAAEAALRAALARAPRHALVITELADLLEVMAGDDHAEATTELRRLLAQVVPGDRAYETDAEFELAVRCLVALAADGRSGEAAALLDRHPELLSGDRPDLFALQLLLRSGIGDTKGLATAFERAAEVLRAAAVSEVDSSALTAQSDVDPEAAAQVLVIAGTLRERDEREGRPAPGVVDDSPATNLYRRALEVAPAYAPAGDALERRLSTGGQWRELADVLEHRVDRQRHAAAAESGAAKAGGPAARDAPGSDGDMVRLLEDLVAVHRDHLDDPVTAGRHQDELIAAGITDARAWVRRHDLELAATARGEGAVPAIKVRTLRELAERAEVPALAAALRVEAARVAAAAEDTATAEGLLNQALEADVAHTAAAALERLAGGSGATAATAATAAARAELVRTEIARALAADAHGTTDKAGGAAGTSGATDAGRAARVRALRFRVAWHALGGQLPADALEAMHPLRASGDAMAQAWSWEIARRWGDPQTRLTLLRGPAVSGADLPAGSPHSAAALMIPADLGETLEEAGDLAAAETAFREAQRATPSIDVALGLLRVGAGLGNGGAVLRGLRELVALADEGTAPQLAREEAMLALLQGEAAAVPAPVRPDQNVGRDHPMDVLLRWAAGARDGDARAGAAGLLGFARALPGNDGDGEAAHDRSGLLARAAARARLGGVAFASSVHDQVTALSGGFDGARAAGSIGVGLSDLPVEGRSERVAARAARAEVNGGALAYALDLERALDAEARGAAAAALDGFVRALGRDAEGIEALDGIKRLALVTGDRMGAARAGMRLGAVLRAPARAAAELGMASQIWEDLGHLQEAAMGYWQALAREPGSTWLYERLRQVLGEQRAGGALDLLYRHRLGVLTQPQERIALLLERAQHRLEHLDDRRAAIDDFKRVLKIEPRHPVALRQLATLALEMEHYTQAVRLLETLLELKRDGSEAAALKLELAEAHEAAREPARAAAVLRQAAAERPGDTAPWHRLTDLLLRMGDWSGALETLRSWDATLADPLARSEIWLRMGRLLRDHARDAAAAATAFGTASELDPLGAAIGELVALHAARGGGMARQSVLRRAIANMRIALATDPLDVPRLRRLKELYEWSAPGRDGVPSNDDAVDSIAGATLAGQLLALAGEDVDLVPARRCDLPPALSADFWARVRAPAAGGFFASVWPKIASAVNELFPGPKLKTSQRERIGHRTEPRLAWVEAAAAAVGLPTLQLWLPRRGDPADDSVLALEEGDPALVLGHGALTGNAVARFRVGRALALLRDHAAVMERIPVSALEDLLPAAAVVAGARLPAAGAAALKQVEDRARVLGKAMNRRDRKALMELDASRFGGEPSDPTAFRHATLASADRLGLLLAGDVAFAARVAGDLGWEGEVSLASATAEGHRRVIELIRFALSADYLALRRECGMGEMGEMGAS